MLLAAPPASSTHSINNAYAYLYTANITFKVFTTNKHKPLFTPPLLKLFKLS